MFLSQKVIKPLVLKALLACVIAITAGCHPLYTDKETGLRIFKLKVAGEAFHISKGYVWAYDHGQDGYISGANLHALYPNFEPKTDKNKAVFDQSGWAGGRLITFLLGSIKDTKSIAKTIDLELANKTSGENSYKNTDLIYYELANKKQLFLTNSASSEQAFFRCTNDSIPYPSCNTRFNYGNKIYIRATFSKELLSQWKTIRQGLIQKVQGFQQAAMSYQTKQGVNGV